MRVFNKFKVLLFLSVILIILSGCGGSEKKNEKAVKPNAVTIKPRAGVKGFASEAGTLPTFVPSGVDGTGRKLLAVYMVGSDLEGDGGAGTTDFKEMLAATGDELSKLEVVVAFGGASNWKGMWFANLEQLRQDSLDSTFSNEPAENYMYVAPGAHMGDASSLKLFLNLLDSYTNFDQRMLVFWDHGANVEGFGNDQNFNNDPLNLNEIEDSLATASQNYNVIGFDTCLMASLEVAKILKSKASYLLASEELEPGHGWNWKHVLEAYATTAGAKEAAISIIDNFVAKGSHPSEQDGKTLSLVDLSKFSDVVDKLEAATTTLTGAMNDQVVISALNNGTTKTQAYGKSPQNNSRVSVDLKHMIHLTSQKLIDEDQKNQLKALDDALSAYVVHAKEDGSRPNSWGVAIDAPENAAKPIGALTDFYNSLRVSTTWVNFAKAYSAAKASDTSAPVVTEFTSGTNASEVNFDLENWDEEWDTDWSGEDQGSNTGSPNISNSEILCETSRSSGKGGYLPFMIGDRRNVIQVKTDRNNRSCLSGTTEGALATFDDPNLSLVRAIYGIVEEYEEGRYFSVLAELNAYPTDQAGQYFSPKWDQNWYTIKLNEDGSSFMPLYFEDQFEEDGQIYSVYVAEVDYYDSDKDYAALGYEFPADYALLHLVVNENSEVARYGIQTYKLQFRDEEDKEGYILIDKTTKLLKVGDKIQFFTYALNLDTPEEAEEWFEMSDVIEVTKEHPEFQLKFLESVDESGEPLSFQYVMWGEDASGNGVLTDYQQNR